VAGYYNRQLVHFLGRTSVRAGEHRQWQNLDRQLHALDDAGCVRVFADKLTGKER